MRWTPSTLAIVLLGAALPLRAPAELARRDRLALLYSHQVVFDRGGEPIVSIGLAVGRPSLTFAADGPLTLLPEADEAFRVTAPAGTKWTVRLAAARPARTRHWVVAERFGAGNLERAAAARRRWAERGRTVGVFEAGALLGFQGLTFDTRTLTVAIDPRDDRAGRRRAGGPGEPWPEVLERPGGALVATEPRGGVEIHARDVLWLVPAPGTTLSVDAGGAPLRIAAPAELYVTVGADGKLVLATLASAEQLVAGVVPGEIFVTAPAAALRAQAVAARGQILGRIGLRHRDDPFMLCARSHCQVYAGDGAGTAETRAAVEATRGEVLFDRDGLVDTVYSSACGGHTEAPHLMWGGQARSGPEGVPDAPAAARPRGDAQVAAFVDRPPAGAWCASSGARAGVFRWSVTRTGEEVSRAVNRLATIGPVRAIEILRRGASGRALEVAYEGLLGRHVVPGESANRRVLGNLRSGLFVVERDGPAEEQPRQWRIRGGGYGHGVGLCQHGAIGMANAGRDHRAILAHYFRGSRLVRLW